MKKLLVTLGIAAITFSGVTGGQVVIKEAPLTWRQASLRDGGELYLELCAVCHGKLGKGDGPAASALSKVVPNLTSIAARNDGIFPRKDVAKTIAGDDRTVSRGSVDMPIWGNIFAELRPDWKQFRREAFARQRIYNLTEYLETLQAE